MRKKIWALSLVLAMVLGTVSIAIAAPLDLVHRVDNTKNYGFTEFVDSPDVFDKVINDAKNYLIEADDGKLYSILEVNEKTKQGKSFEEAIKELEPVELDDKDLEVIEVSAINAKGLKVVFNRPITKEEAAKDLKVEIKRGNVPVNVKDVEFTKDLKALEIELVTKLRKGTYTVAVKGLTDEALTGSVEVEDEKVAKIELGDKAVLQKEKQKEEGKEEVYVTDYTKAKVSCKVFNQYGEDITEKESSGDYHITPVGAKSATFDTKKKAITLEPIADEFKLGDKIRVTVVNTKTGVSTSKEIEVSAPAAVAEINFGKIYNEDDKELNNETINSDEFYLLFEAKDQYGNKIENVDELTADLIPVSTNPYIVKAESIEKKTIDGKDHLALKLGVEGEPNFKGTATIKLISKTTGKTFKHNVTVNEAPRVDKVVLSKPEELVVEGEKVEIPFIALDQFGNEITKHNELSGKIELEATEGTVELGKDPVTKEAVIEFEPGENIVKGKEIDAKKPVIITVKVKEEGHFSLDQITVDVMKKAQPVTVSGLKDVATSVSPGATLDIKAKNVKVFDQYGREMKLDSKFFTDYNIKIAYTDDTKDDYAVTIDDTNNTINSTDAIIQLKGAKKGSEEFKLFLDPVKDEPIAESEYVFTVECVDKTAIEEYEVADIDPILVDENGNIVNDHEIKVHGIKADGSKVLIGKNYYTINTNSELVTYDGEFKAGTGLKDALDDKGEITLTLTFTISAEGTPVIVRKNVVVKYADNEIAEIEFNDEEVKNGIAELTAENGEISYTKINNLFVYKDQYGNKMKDENPAISITNFTDLNGKEFNGAETVNEGDSFNIVQDKVVAEFNATVATDKASKTVKVVVEDAETVQNAIEERLKEQVSNYYSKHKTVKDGEGNNVATIEFNKDEEEFNVTISKEVKDIKGVKGTGLIANLHSAGIIEVDGINTGNMDEVKSHILEKLVKDDGLADSIKLTFTVKDKDTDFTTKVTYTFNVKIGKISEKE